MSINPEHVALQSCSKDQHGKCFSVHLRSSCNQCGPRLQTAATASDLSISSLLTAVRAYVVNVKCRDARTCLGYVLSDLDLPYEADSLAENASAICSSCSQAEDDIEAKPVAA